MRLNKTEAGLIVVTDPGSDRPLLEVKTLQCVHCGGHWVPKPGSGRVRGWCMNCNGPICGAGCKDCVPTEQLLENIEKNQPLDFRPIIASVPRTVR